jgi:hypothetical protein
MWMREKNFRRVISGFGAKYMRNAFFWVLGLRTLKNAVLKTFFADWPNLRSLWAKYKSKFWSHFFA